MANYLTRLAAAGARRGTSAKPPVAAPPIMPGPLLALGPDTLRAPHIPAPASPGLSREEVPASGESPRPHLSPSVPVVRAPRSLRPTSATPAVTHGALQREGDLPAVQRKRSPAAEVEPGRSEAPGSRREPPVAVAKLLAGDVATAAHTRPEPAPAAPNRDSRVQKASDPEVPVPLQVPGRPAGGHRVPEPRPTASPPPRQGEARGTRVTIGRLEVQVINRPPLPPAAPRSRPSPGKPGGDLAGHFLDRFSLRR